MSSVPLYVITVPMWCATRCCLGRGRAEEEEWKLFEKGDLVVLLDDEKRGETFTFVRVLSSRFGLMWMIKYGAAAYMEVVK